MNILDINDETLYTPIHSFEELYKEAKEQFIAFMNVETKGEIKTWKDWEDYGFSIDYPDDQLLYKNFLQIRFSEELTEASVDIEHVDHYLEEMTDAFNFFITSFIILGKEFKELPKWVDIPGGNEKMIRAISSYENKYKLYEVIEKANWLCNLLKNRTWTQTNFLVSRFDFDNRLLDFWKTFNAYVNHIGLDLNTLFLLFAKKKAINMFRLNSNY